MKKIHRLAICTFIFVSGLCALGAKSAILPSINSNYIDSVDFYLKRANYYTNLAFSDINRELAQLDSIPVELRFEKMAVIGRRLEQIDADSALWIYTQAEELAERLQNERYINKFRFRQGGIMPMMGLIREGIEVYSSVRPEMVDFEDKFDYFATGKHIFDAATDYYRVDSLKQKYIYLSNVYNDSTLSYVEPGTLNELYYRALPKLNSTHHGNGIADLNDLLRRAPIDDPIFAKAAADLAMTYAKRNDWKNAKYYLALSAISDLQAGTREVTSLQRLGRLLNNEEDYVRAYDYLTYALEASVSSGSSMRTIEIGEIMPVVVKTGRHLDQERSKTLFDVVVMLSVAVMIFIGLAIYAFMTRSSLAKARKQLVDSNDSKDLYIKELLSLCGANLSALENFNKLVGRKIKVGQVSDLLAMIESGKVIRDQLQSFYEVFDDAFLAVYPDFVERVNELLLPDKQLSLTDDGRLSMELRIVAFMRLGLDDSAQIAKFLGLTLNTIYTYRNKIKNRAVDRANFEENVRNIGRR